jgi:hypothetical protein
MRHCWYCGTEAVSTGKVDRKEICPKCKMAVKCCRNCRFFDTSAPKQCREPAAEFVGDKDGANFCEYFEFVEQAGRRTGRQVGDAKSKFDSLFKK